MESSGWRLFAHPLFGEQLVKLTERVERLAAKDPRGFDSHPAAKILATINRHVREVISRNPNSLEFRQGNTFGPGNRHWFRAQFHGRYRLFFRFSAELRIIIYVWVNDEETLRKAGSKSDPYAVFRAMLENGSPASSFSDLLRTSKEMRAGRKTGGRH